MATRRKISAALPLGLLVGLRRLARLRRWAKHPSGSLRQFHLRCVKRERSAVLRHDLRRRIKIMSMVPQADVLEVLPQGHDPVVESHVGSAATQFVNFEPAGGFVGDVEALAVTLRSQKDVVLNFSVDGLSEHWLETNNRNTV